MSNPPELGIRGKVAMALSLTVVGGFVDAVGYIALFQIFTANMSGNSIHIGMYLGQQNWREILRFLCAAGSYVVGMTLTRIAVEIAGRRSFRRIASITLAVEASLLALFARATPAMHLGQLVNLHSPEYFSLVALLAFAMGVQTATLTHIGPLTVYTTFVTGTVTKLTESFTRVLFWFHDESRRIGISDIVRQAPAHPDVQQSTMLASTWSCYVLGAATGAILEARWQLRALYIPVALLAAFILIDQLRPIDIQEMKHQTGQKPA